MPYLLRRLLHLPLSLFLLSVACFVLSKSLPGDPLLQLPAPGSVAEGSDGQSAFALYRLRAQQAGHDLPPFYLGFSNATLPDTFHRITVPAHRETLSVLAARYGNWPGVQAYYRSLVELAFLEADASVPTVTAARALLRQTDPEAVQSLLAQLPAEAAAVRQGYRRLTTQARPYRALWPRMHWYGTNSQYHHYVSRLLRGNWGVSFIDRRPVVDKLRQALPTTVLVNGLALLLIYLLAVPLGMYMARFRDTAFDRLATVLTFVAFGIPGFWVATLLANFFTTPAFGMDWFPSMGLGEIPTGSGLSAVLKIRAAHLFLPVCCLTYPSLAYVARHLRSAALSEYRLPYVATARMKGLTEGRVLWHHVFRNAAFPLITLLGGLLPALLAGSVLIEQIFNLPGMGQLLYVSALARDWPVVTALVLLNGVATTLGLILADLGYVLADPRVRLHPTAHQ